MIRILTDSASDILPAEAEQLGVTVIPLNVTLEDSTVLRDGVDMTPTEYYGILAGCHKLPTTAKAGARPRGRSAPPPRAARGSCAERPPAPPGPQPLPGTAR